MSLNFAIRRQIVRAAREAGSQKWREPAVSRRHSARENSAVSEPTSVDGCWHNSNHQIFSCFLIPYPYVQHYLYSRSIIPRANKAMSLSVETSPWLLGTGGR